MLQSVAAKYTSYQQSNNTTNSKKHGKQIQTSI